MVITFLILIRFEKFFHQSTDLAEIYRSRMVLDPKSNFLKNFGPKVFRVGRVGPAHNFSFLTFGAITQCRSRLCVIRRPVSRLNFLIKNKNLVVIFDIRSNWCTKRTWIASQIRTRFWQNGVTDRDQMVSRVFQIGVQNFGKMVPEFQKNGDQIFTKWWPEIMSKCVPDFGTRCKQVKAFTFGEFWCTFFKNGQILKTTLHKMPSQTKQFDDPNRSHLGSQMYIDWPTQM